MRGRLLAAVLAVAFASVPAFGQTVNPSIRVTGQNGAECTTGQLCIATGANWLLGYGNDAAKAAAYFRVYSVMADGREIQANSVWPNIGRLNFSPDLSAAGAVAYRFRSQFLDQITQQLAPTPTASPALVARGTACYARPLPGACVGFDSVLTFPRHVGLLTVTLDAGGLGAFSTLWTIVIEDGPNSEVSIFAVELAAVSFPASSAHPQGDLISFTVGRIPPGTYFIYAYKLAENGTLIKSPRVPIVIAAESE